jgi:hypothetical protein
MFSKIIFFSLALALIGCTENTDKITSGTQTVATDTPLDSYRKELKQLEQESSNKHTDNLGKLIKSISFESGIDSVASASIESPEEYSAQLLHKDEVVINEPKITVIIDYPLTNEYTFDLESKNGFTRWQLLKAISDNYYKLYAEEEKSATVKTIPIAERKTMYNRNRTNGKYGIWGHDIADLILDEILVYRTPAGKTILALIINS